MREAISAFEMLDARGKRIHYYGGGTELISMGRIGSLTYDALIDIKYIPECKTLEIKDGWLAIGAGVTLTRISEAKVFPLLGRTGARIADHTIQGQITLGGNLASSIIYREISIPLLLADAEVIIVGPGGERRAPLERIFDRRLRLGRGEFIARAMIPERYVSTPHYHAKKTKIDIIDYPLLTIAALKTDGRIRVAFSGLCDFPFRSAAMEDELNRAGVAAAERIEAAAARVPAPILDDLRGSPDYRKFVLRHELQAMMENLEGAV